MENVKVNKYAINNPEICGVHSKMVSSYFSSPSFLEWLTKLTGIPGLQNDPDNNAVVYIELIKMDYLIFTQTLIDMRLLKNIEELMFYYILIQIGKKNIMVN